MRAGGSLPRTAIDASFLNCASQIIPVGRVLFIEEFKRGAPEEKKNGRDFRKHPAAVRAHEGMLEFGPLRESIREHTKDLSRYYNVRAPPKPADFDLRIARISLAIYLLDTLEKMLEHADARKTESIYSGFESARKAVLDFLAEGYFAKSAEEILRNYPKCEQALLPAASRCGVQVLEPEHAVESTKMKVADMIDEINGMF